ncbi:MAG: hypothetical protein GY862_32875 [Gammaproteobacteria bacterium]|nr:hypothetical protein [Gammaproteobacteria bacterium]
MKKIFQNLLFLFVLSNAFLNPVFAGADNACPCTTADELKQCGIKAFEHGKFAKALERWRREASFYEEQSVAHIGALIRQAKAYQRLGHYPRAVEKLWTALEWMENSRRDTLIPAERMDSRVRGNDGAEASRGKGEAEKFDKRRKQIKKMHIATLAALGNICNLQNDSTLRKELDSFNLEKQAVPLKRGIWIATVDSRTYANDGIKILSLRQRAKKHFQRCEIVVKDGLSPNNHAYLNTALKWSEKINDEPGLNAELLLNRGNKYALEAMDTEERNGASARKRRNLIARMLLDYENALEAARGSAAIPLISRYYPPGPRLC